MPLKYTVNMVIKVYCGWVIILIMGYRQLNADYWIVKLTVGIIGKNCEIEYGLLEFIFTVKSIKI